MLIVDNYNLKIGNIHTPADTTLSSEMLMVSWNELVEADCQARGVSQQFYDLLGKASGPT